MLRTAVGVSPSIGALTVIAPMHAPDASKKGDATPAPRAIHPLLE